eukprot:1162059-Pelagomonas_calceolata.AAC.10
MRWHDEKPDNMDDKALWVALDKAPVSRVFAPEVEPELDARQPPGPTDGLKRLTALPTLPP